MTKPPVLYIVIPCYNEEKVLPITSKEFLNKIYELIGSKKIHKDSRILFVNDGSKNSTWEIIKKLSEEDEHYIGIAQSRNRGHQNAVLAELMEAKDNCDITFSIDCDDQDDINAMNQMIEEYINGAEIVYGVRSSRKTDTFFKRFTSQSFYKFLSKMGAEVVYNHADYRLVSSKVLNAFADFKEVNIFLRGMFPLVGFKSTFVLAFDGITSLSVKPLHIIVGVGIFISFLSFIGVIWSVVMQLIGKTIPGLASTTSIVRFIGGIQLMSIGVLGEYIGKIYMKAKARLV